MIHDLARRDALRAARAAAMEAREAEEEAARNAPPKVWTRRGMCPRCEGSQYLDDQDPFTHCGQMLVHLQERDGKPIG